MGEGDADWISGVELPEDLRKVNSWWPALWEFCVVCAVGIKLCRSRC